jgi:hypothetical protein
MLRKDADEHAFGRGNYELAGQKGEFADPFKNICSLDGYAVSGRLHFYKKCKQAIIL